jgi:hypothetical protein
MKVTQKMLEAYVKATRKWSMTNDEDLHGGRKVGIQAVLDLIDPVPGHVARGLMEAAAGVLDLLPLRSVKDYVIHRERDEAERSG